MKIILDNREHYLYDKINAILLAIPNPSIQLFFEPIPLGDILIKTDEDKTIAIIERKTVLDLLSSIKDGRYEEQSYRLSHSEDCCPHNIIYLIEGMFSVSRTLIEKKMVISSICSLSHFKGFSIFRTMNMQETADLVLAFTDKIGREYAKGRNGFYMTRTIPTPTHIGELNQGSTEDISSQQIVETSYSTVVNKVKKENLTPENMGEIMLSQIPGISTVTATAIIRHFGSLIKTIDALKDPNTKKEFDNITYMTNGKSRRIGKTVYENICKFIC
jgi:crossover junction endonuclease MUS81